VPASIPVQKRGIAAVQAAIEAGDGDAADRAWDAIADGHAAEVIATIAAREGRARCG
jgi:hypothetical protein